MEVYAIYKHFSGFEFFLLPSIVHARPNNIRQCNDWTAMSTNSKKGKFQMSKHIYAPTILRVLQIGITIIQLFDIIIHAATNQLEILRVSSNVIILLWLATVAMGKFNVKFLQLAVSSIGAYLVLNIIFLAINGVTNTEQGGGLRTTLFLLAFLTITLSTLLANLQGKHIKNYG